MPTHHVAVVEPTDRTRSGAVTTESFALAAELEILSPTLVVRPLADTVIDTIGHEVRSVYVETFYLPVVGPTALWLARRLVSGLDQFPDGYELDLAETARALGLGFASGKAGPFVKALDRCSLFGLTRPAPDGLAVRRKLAPLPRRHVERMPPHLRTAHAAWVQHHDPRTDDDAEFARATALARALRGAGDAREVAEHHLLALGVEPALAALALSRSEELAGDVRP